MTLTYKQFCVLTLVYIPSYPSSCEQSYKTKLQQGTIPSFKHMIHVLRALSLATSAAKLALSRFLVMAPDRRWRTQTHIIYNESAWLQLADMVALLSKCPILK